MKKVIIAYLLVAMTVFMCSLNVFATEAPGAELLPINTAPQDVPYGDTLNGMMRSLSKPDNFFDLDDGDYHAILHQVGPSWLYTNSYFICNQKAELYLSYKIYSDTGNPTKMKIGLYDLDKKQFVVTEESGGSTLSGISESIRFYNLDKTHN